MTPAHPGRLARTAAVLTAVVLSLGGCATRAPAPAAPATAAATFATPAREVLNSERITQRFGSYGLDVLDARDNVRVASLYSLENGGKVCRTFAVSVLAVPTDPAVAEEDRIIRAGGSIGVVFQQRGWTIEKRQRLIAELPPPGPGDRVTTLMRLASPVPLALHLYTFVVRKGAASVPYATISELYHPDYLRLDDVRALYGRDVPATAAGDPELAPLVELVQRAAKAPLD